MQVKVTDLVIKVIPYYSVFVLRSLYSAGIMNSAVIMEENVGNGKQFN